MTDIVIVNRSSALTDHAIAAVIPAFQAQVNEDWAPHWNNRGAYLHFAGKTDPVPQGMWPLFILDHTDIPGAGGYHSDDHNLPQGKVFAADAITYGEAWTVDATHELLEMLGDPGTDTIVELPHNLHCLQEVCDACEADKFGYEKSGVRVTDFCLPQYFDRSGDGPFDFKGHLHHPAPALLSGGYLGIELPNGMWTQIVKRNELGEMSRRAKRVGRTVPRLGVSHE